MSTKLSHPTQSQLNPHGGKVQYRRAAEAIAAHEQQTSQGIGTNGNRRQNRNSTHRVVAHPMDPITPVHTSPASQQHPPPPALYDTSVSSATLTNSAEDGRSTGSSGGTQYRLSKRTQQTHPFHESMTRNPEIAQRYSPRNNNRYSSQHHHHHQETDNTTTDPVYVTQSEPGGGVVSIEHHDRFAAYINRFAELDPRMDHRRYTVEEKKNDDPYHRGVPSSSPPQQQSPMDQTDLIKQKNRFRTRTGNPDQQQQNLANDMVAASHSHEEHQSFKRRGLRSYPTEEAVSDIITNSPSSRTRDLARRIEQHMGRKQLKQQQHQQQRESRREDYNDISPSHESAVNTRVSFEEATPSQITNVTPPSTKPITQPHFYYPQSQLAATYIPIPKPQQYVESTTYPHQTSRRVSPRKESPQQHKVESRRIDVSNAPTYPEGNHERHSINMPTATETYTNASIRSQQAIRQQQQQQRQITIDTYGNDDERNTLIYDRQSTRQNLSAPPPQQETESHHRQPNTRQRSSRQQEESLPKQQQQQKQQPRSRSLGPPQRRQQSLRAHESVPTQAYSSPTENNCNSQVEDQKNEVKATSNEPNIRRLGNRAEIETPLPANVRELRRMLWSEDELLQVRVRSSYRDVDNHEGNYYGHRTHRVGPEMAGTAGQRNARSLSPKTHRMRNSSNETGNRQQHGVSAREHKGMLFKSRYYEAALRGEMSHSPKRGLVNTVAEPEGGNNVATLPVTRSYDSMGPLKQQKSSSPSDIRTASTEDIDTTLAIQPDITNSNLHRKATYMQNMDHEKKLEATDASMKEDFAAYLLRKINQVSKDDPQAALAEINALLRQQPATTEVRAEPVHEKNIQHLDDPASREMNSVPGVEPARPMEGDDESDDESDGTSVSSMTNPTFQELNNKDHAPISPSGGRPRPSRLGPYNNMSHKALSNDNRLAVETRSQHVVKEDQSIAAVLDNQTNDNAVGNGVSEFQQIEDRHTIKSETSNIVLDKSSPNVVEKRSAPSLLSQLGSLISPQQFKDPTVHSKEISEKIKHWDELSTGAIQVDSTQASTMNNSASQTPKKVEESESRSSLKLSGRRNLSPGGELKREHPWDSAIPVRMGQINMKDTSMDCGDGVEAEFTPKHSKVSSAVRKEQSPVGQQTFSNCKVVEEKKEAPQYMSNQYQQTKAMSDEFDSAWVSLPSSTFFGTKQNTSQSNRDNGVSNHQRSSMPIIQKKVPGEELEPSDTPDDVEVEYLLNSTRIRSKEIQTIVPEESNQSYAQLRSPTRDVYPRHRKSSTFDDSYEQHTNESVLNTSKSFETAPVTGVDAKPRSRGLRGFLKRKQAEKAQAGGSIDRTSASVASRRSAATTATATRPLGEFVDIEASTSNGNNSDIVNRYTRRSAKSRSPSRNRSRSVDERRTIRNPSLAQKFNRLLRVYDHDDTGRNEV